MSLHFSYHFREDLIKKLRDHYNDDLDKLMKEREIERQLDEAAKIIDSYYDNFLSEIGDVMEASDGEVSFVKEGSIIAKLIIRGNYLKFMRVDNSIEVKIGYYVPEADLVESVVLSYIIPGDKKARVRRVGKIHDGSSFDENSISYYMREAFHKVEL